MAIVITSKPSSPDDRLDVAWDEARTELRAFVARRISEPEVVEDLVQDVLVRLHATASSGVRITNVPAWLYRVARNTIIDYYRSRRREETLNEAAVVADPSSWPHTNGDDEPSAVRELAQCLRPLIDRLPKAYGDALLLTDLDGMTQASAAAALGLSVPGMKSRVQRARLKLRALLVECCPVEVDARGAVIDFVQPTESCGCNAACCSSKRG
jgi:RNA polymerase sigma-70 factor (ECF subfamily)